MRTTHDKKPKNSKKPTLLPERPNLTKAQIEFLHYYTSSPFIPINEICRQAGVVPSQVAKWKKGSERFRAALRTEHLRTQQVTNMSRKRVMHGLLESIDMAKDQRQPSTMISGWKEVGRMCGFYEPEKREIQLSVTGKEVIEELKGLTRTQLLELASHHETTIEDAEYEVMDEYCTPHSLGRREKRL